MIRFIATLSLAALAAAPGRATEPGDLFAAHCAECHGPSRLGGLGPALIPETLGRMRGPALAEVIATGRPNTQMPAFSGELGADEIAALAA
ncbi:MAG TPA: cytochrome c, partial [Amaricoccus sp.]|nr:cytochrome c [Amaricoccus sp.]